MGFLFESVAPLGLFFFFSSLLAPFFRLLHFLSLCRGLGSPLVGSLVRSRFESLSFSSFLVCFDARWVLFWSLCWDPAYSSRVSFIFLGLVLFFIFLFFDFFWFYVFFNFCFRCCKQPGRCLCRLLCRCPPNMDQRFLVGETPPIGLCLFLSLRRRTFVLAFAN